MRTIVVAGASMAGLRAVEGLRAQGWQHEIIVIGDEPHMPYSRPPLSKGLWANHAGLDSLELRRRPAADSAHWLLGSAITACDLASRTVELGALHTIEFEGLVIATGVRPRRLANPEFPANRICLRTLDDYLAAREALESGAKLVIAGSGFIGCEIAASAASIGCEVDVVSLDDEPMLVPLGQRVGAAVRRRLEETGVRFHGGRTIKAMHGDSVLQQVQLDDQSRIDCDLLIECIGSIPNVEWLAGNALDVTDGVLCDEQLRVIGADRVVACGDVARFPDPVHSSVARRVEHWGIAAPTAKRAAQTLLADIVGEPVAAEPFTVLPNFWSDQGPVRIQGFGDLRHADDFTLLRGDLSGDTTVAYTRAGLVVGLVMLGAAGDLAQWRSWVTASIGRPLDSQIAEPSSSRPHIRA